MTDTIKPADNLYNAYSNWNKAATPAIMQAKTEEELSAASNQAGLFDFQQGKDYSTSLHALVVGEVNAYDADKGGTISYEEFLAQGKKEYEGIIDNNTIKLLEESSAFLLNFWAQDIDIDDQISIEDLELFYSIADESLTSEENKRVKDGKFSQDDLALAMETMLNMLQEENPALESELSARSEEISQAKKEDKKAELKKILGWDIDKDKEIQKEEFMLAMEKLKGDTPEAKAGAHCVYEILNSVIGDDFDGKNTLDMGDIGLYIENQYDSGFDFEEYYDYLLENFTDENSPNHGYYERVLAAYSA